ncbi:MAG: hypothetical protein KJ907_02115 [Actinobacteria bacterium]|nr:hypothetical protein [Actinomycetota bacterium]
MTKETITLTYTGDTLTRAGETVALLALLSEEHDGYPGDIKKSSSVVFEIWNSQGIKVREVVARVLETSPGKAIAEVLTEPLPTDLYTIRVRLSNNSYYESEETSGELAVYDPQAGFVVGAGILMEDGLKTFCFHVKYKK